MKPLPAKYIISLTAVILLASTIYAATEKLNAVIKNVSGNVEIKRSLETQWMNAKTGLTLTEGDIIRTKNNSFAIISIKNNGSYASVELKKNSQLMFLEFSKDTKSATQNIILDLAVGEATIHTEETDIKTCKFEVKTPTSIVEAQKGSATFDVRVEREI